MVTSFKFLHSSSKKGNPAIESACKAPADLLDKLTQMHLLPLEAQAMMYNMQCVYVYTSSITTSLSLYIYIWAVIKSLTSGNGSFVKRNFPFRETFAVSFAGHFIMHISWYQALFLQLSVSRTWATAYAGSILFRCYYRGTVAKFYAGFPENGCLDDIS